MELVTALRSWGAEGSFAFNQGAISALENDLLFKIILTTHSHRFEGEHIRFSEFRPTFQKVDEFLIWIAARILEGMQIQPSIRAAQNLRKCVSI